MKLIPLFPLEIVVFPREKLNLHVFEPRYKQLIHDCKAEVLIFGIPFYRKDHKLEYGTTVMLDKVFKTYSDGRMDVKTVGLVPFEVKRFSAVMKDKLYPGGYVEELFWEAEGDAHLYTEIEYRLKDLYGFMNIKKLPKELATMKISFDIAHKVGFNQEQEYRFLQIVGEVDRQRYMINHLDKLIPRVKEMEEMRKKIQMNGHFKNIIPPTL